MEKIIGKLYSYGQMVIMCTGNGKDDDTKRIAGVVVYQPNTLGDHPPLGTYSETWTFHPSVCCYHEGIVQIDSSVFKPHKQYGATATDA